ncbi:MAG: hypothetical protein ACREDR_41480, partial [Blastocatellia bacterium]
YQVGKVACPRSVFQTFNLSRMIHRLGRRIYPRSLFHILKLSQNDLQVRKVALAPLRLATHQTAQSPADVKLVSGQDGGLAPALSFKLSTSPE